METMTFMLNKALFQTRKTHSISSLICNLNCLNLKIKLHSSRTNCLNIKRKSNDNRRRKAICSSKFKNLKIK